MVYASSSFIMNSFELISSWWWHCYLIINIRGSQPSLVRWCFVSLQGLFGWHSFRILWHGFIIRIHIKLCSLGEKNDVKSEVSRFQRWLQFYQQKCFRNYKLSLLYPNTYQLLKTKEYILQNDHSPWIGASLLFNMFYSAVYDKNIIMVVFGTRRHLWLLQSSVIVAS